MNRRTFLRTAASAVTVSAVPIRTKAAQLRRKVLFACIDGLDPAYIQRSETPNLDRLIREGTYVEGSSIIPSVTNVNNASIATASFPEEHGITSNFFYDRATGKSTYMETAEFVLRPTLLEKAAAAGAKCALVTAKDKIRRLLARQSHVSISSENAPSGMIEALGPVPGMYTPDVNYWMLEATRRLLKTGSDLVYLATTDYMMHTYPPEDARSLEHVHQMDRLLGQIVEDHPQIEVYLTADHGMNAKIHGIDLARLLAESGIRAEAIPIIKDRHVVHHGNLGGACYIYLADMGDFSRAWDSLKRVEGIAEMHDRDTAAKTFRLHRERIGDIFVLGEKHVAFGSLENTREPIQIRSHGSRFESTVPILCYGHKADAGQYRFGLDLSRHFSWRE